MLQNSAGVRAQGGPFKSSVSLLKSYVEVTKPRSVFLLVFTALAVMVVAGAGEPLPTLLWVKASLAITLACSGTNAVSCYIDRDIDAIMERTKKRPIPSGRIAPAIKALYWGLAQFALACAVAWSINFFSFLCILLGMLGYVGVYSLWLKRKSTWNIVLGGFSGGLPALFGWVAVRGEITPLSLAIALLVVLWIPNHIWNLAIYYKDDYRRVGVPMLPVVYEVKRTLLYIMLTVVAMFVLSLIIYQLGDMGKFYLCTALVTGLIIVGGNIYLYFNCENKGAWWLYKLSSPYLFFIFLAMIIDRWGARA